jgi:hypothetical protein
MKKDKNKITVNPNLLKVRDEAIKDMIATTGGVARVFPDRKRKTKADRVSRKAKYPPQND